MKKGDKVKWEDYGERGTGTYIGEDIGKVSNSYLIIRDDKNGLTWDNDNVKASPQIDLSIGTKYYWWVENIKPINKSMKKQYGHPDFYKILEELATLHSSKNYQYSTDKDPLSNFKSAGRMVEKLFKPNINVPLATALIYMSKQYDGVINIVGEGKENTVEALEDKLKDIAVYAILCIILNNEIQTKKGVNNSL